MGSIEPISLVIFVVSTISLETRIIYLINFDRLWLLVPVTMRKQRTEIELGVKKLRKCLVWDYRDRFFF